MRVLDSIVLTANRLIYIIKKHVIITITIVTIMILIIIYVKKNNVINILINLFL